MHMYRVAVFCVLLIASTAFNFKDKDDIYNSKFDTCLPKEERITKCINGVCVSRTDTLERQPLCVCLEGYTGKRCELSFLPLYIIYKANE